MKINVVCVGKLKEKYLADAVAEYAKRISRFAEIKVIELAEAAQSKSVDEQIEIEGDEILKAAKGTLVALDSHGKQMTSEEFAAFFDAKCTAGTSEFSFVIGGSNGLSDAVKKRAENLVSFSKMTFPHQLFRVMLLEQIYRAMAINNHVPYHK